MAETGTRRALPKRQNMTEGGSAPLDVDSPVGDGRTGIRFPHEGKVYPPDSKEFMSFSFTRNVVVLARRWQTLVDEMLGEIGQTQARWETLFAILRTKPAPTQRQLAETLGVEAPTLVRVLHRLEEEGLVERCPVEGDRRAWTIRLKPGTGDILAQCSEIIFNLRRRYLQDIEEEELKICLSVLGRILDRLERH